MCLAKTLCLWLSKHGIQNRADMDNTNIGFLLVLVLNLASTTAVVNIASIYQIPKAGHLYLLGRLQEKSFKFSTNSLKIRMVWCYELNSVKPNCRTVYPGEMSKCGKKKWKSVLIWSSDSFTALFLHSTHFWKCKGFIIRWRKTLEIWCSMCEWNEKCLT